MSLEKNDLRLEHTETPELKLNIGTQEIQMEANSTIGLEMENQITVNLTMRENYGD